MANGISRDTFDGMDVDSKLGVLFDYAKLANEKQCATAAQVEALKQKFDRRKRLDTAVSGASGFMGGAVVVFVKWVIGK